MSGVTLCEHRQPSDDCDRCRLADLERERRLTAHFAALRTVSGGHFRLSPGSAIELLAWLDFDVSDTPVAAKSYLTAGD